jgi:hypothetical protein
MFAVVINSSNNGTSIGCLAGIGKLLMRVIAGKDLHVRLVIARAANRARRSQPRAE